MLRNLLLTAGLLATVAIVSAEAPKGDAAAEKAALSELNSLIGGWRGIGQVRRGSNSGAWSEHGEWTWKFEDHKASIQYDVEKGKLFRSGRVSYAPDTKTYTLVATLPDETTRTYAGQLDGKKLVLTTPEDADEVHRLTVTKLNDERTLVLYEKRTKSQEQFSRVAEVGYTRDGVRLAKEGSNGPECVVTGGVGTITVSFKGKTYYVCCTGCKQAFEDDPEGVLAEYAALKAKGK
jgi:hypothetical protein